MFAKIALLTLLGVALVSAGPPAHHASTEVDHDVDFLRNDFSQIFHAFLNNLEEAAKRVSTVAKAKLQEFKKIFLELKDQVSAELETLRGQLQERISEAKKYGQEKYEQIKQQAKKTLQEKSVEFKDQIRELQQKVTNYLDGLPHQEFTHGSPAAQH